MIILIVVGVLLRLVNAYQFQVHSVCSCGRPRSTLAAKDFLGLLVRSRTSELARDEPNAFSGTLSSAFQESYGATAYFSCVSHCSDLSVLLFARIVWLWGLYRKYSPGLTEAMCSMRSRAFESPSIDSSQWASLSEVPEKISNVGSLILTLTP